jgi:hypothetical protein
MHDPAIQTRLCVPPPPPESLAPVSTTRFLPSSRQPCPQNFHSFWAPLHHTKIPYPRNNYSTLEAIVSATTTPSHSDSCRRTLLPPSAAASDETVYVTPAPRTKSPSFLSSKETRYFVPNLFRTRCSQFLSCQKASNNFDHRMIRVTC